METLNRQPDRRGMAMLLVLVSVAMATILATAYLASRDNSIVIGDNSNAAVQSRWAGLSALETGIAVLQTETDWRHNHTGGVLINNFALAGANITMSAVDLESGALPSDTTEYMTITARATADIDGDGVSDGTQEIVARAYVPATTNGYFCTDLADFAIFAQDEIDLRDDATVSRWPEAPLSVLGRRIAIATLATSSSSVEILNDSACIDTTLYHRDIASGALMINESGPYIKQVAMPMTVPIVNEVPDYAADPFSPNPYTDLEVVSGTDTIASNGSLRYLTGHVFNATLILQGNLEVITNSDLDIEAGAKLVIDGDITLIVFDDFRVLDNSSIQLAPGATLRIFIGDDMVVDDGFIGEQGPAARDHTGGAPYMDPSRIRIFTIDRTSSSDRDWKLRNNSVVKATVFGPDTYFQLYDDSALYGRVMCKDFRMENNCGLFYDHSLDERQGFANINGKAYNSAVVSGVNSQLSSYDAAELQGLADSVNFTVKAHGMTIDPSGYTGPPPPDPLLPTPRPVAVEYEVLSFGTDMSQFEDAN